MNNRFSLKNIATDFFIYTGILSIVYLLGGPMRYKPADVSLISSGFNQKTIEEKVERGVDYRSMSLEEVIEYVKTPKQAQDYLNAIDVPSNSEETDSYYNIKNFSLSKKSKTFREVHSSGEATCLGHSIAAAALLKDNGYSPIIMFLENKGFSQNHAVYLYKQKGKYGVLSTSSLKPEFDNIDEIKNELRKKYPENKPRAYWLADLDKSFPNEEWIYGDISPQPNVLEKAKIFFFSRK